MRKQGSSSCRDPGHSSNHDSVWTTRLRATRFKQFDFSRYRKGSRRFDANLMCWCVLIELGLISQVSRKFLTQERVACQFCLFRPLSMFFGHSTSSSGPRIRKCGNFRFETAWGLLLLVLSATIFKVGSYSCHWHIPLSVPVARGAYRTCCIIQSCNAVPRPVSLYNSSPSWWLGARPHIPSPSQASALIVIWSSSSS